MNYLKRIQELRRQTSISQPEPALPKPQKQPQALPIDDDALLSDKRVAYMVDLPMTFEGRQYKPGNIVYLTEREAIPFLQPQVAR